MRWTRRLGTVLALASMSALAAPAAPPASAPTSAREAHTALCVAALDVNTRELAEQVKAGHHALQPLLLGRLRSGAAFIGAAYMAGDRDEGRSRVLLDAALEAQKALPQVELAARQAACAAEGEGLLARANPIERALLNRVAARRMERLLSR